MKNDVIETIVQIYELPNKSNDILKMIMELLADDNTIKLNSDIKKRIQKATNKGIESINKYIWILVENNILSRQGRGLYKASEKLFTASWTSLLPDTNFRISITFKNDKRMIRVKVLDT